MKSVTAGSFSAPIAVVTTKTKISQNAATLLRTSAGTLRVPNHLFVTEPVLVREPLATTEPGSSD